MNRIKIALIGAAAAIPLAGVALTSAAGPNLIKNGDFAGGVANWSSFGSSPSPVAASGAMQVSNPYTGTGNSYYGSQQCVTGIQPGQDYTATADVFVGNDQPARGTAGVYFHFRDDPNCNGNNLGGGHMSAGYSPENRGKWVSLKSELEAPATAKSLLIVASAVKEPVVYADSVPATMVALFDNMTLTVADVIAQPTATPTQAPTQAPQPSPTAQPTAAPTDGPKDPGNVVSNPKPSSTPQAPNTGDSGPANSGGDEPSSATTNTGIDIEVIPAGPGPSNSQVGTADEPGTAGNTGAKQVTETDDHGSTVLGLGLLFIAAGMVFAGAGLGISTLAKRRSDEA